MNQEITGPNCKICRRADREAIDLALTRGETERATAEQFGLAKGTVHRHRSRCIRRAITDAIERQHVQMGDSLLKMIDYLLEKVLVVVARAEGRRKDLLLLKAIGQSLDVLRLRADLTGARPEPAPRMNYQIIFEAGRPVARVIEAPALPEGNPDAQ